MLDGTPNGGLTAKPWGGKEFLLLTHVGASRTIKDLNA